MADIARSLEADAFLDARQHTGPRVVTACRGWTAHDVTAHLAGIAAEITRHLEPCLQGDAVPATRSFEEREAPFRAMDDAALCRRLADEEQAARSVIGQVLAERPDAVIPWTGRTMAVAKFPPHLRNEFAIHRWDLVGDDDLGAGLLGQPELTEHAVGVLGRILLVRGFKDDPRPGEDFHVRLRVEHGPDIRLVVEAGQAGLELVAGQTGGRTGDQTDEPHVDLDPAARTLLIWGRRPDRRDRFRSALSQPDLQRMQMLLAGY